jgi:hypothetical protein
MEVKARGFSPDPRDGNRDEIETTRAEVERSRSGKQQFREQERPQHIDR